MNEHPPNQDTHTVDASIVIPVWNKLEVTRLCLARLLSLSTETRARHEIIVVDNASSDGTHEYLADVAHNNPSVRVLTHPENLGFVDGCNSGAALARGRYIVFLNNDTEPERGWLDALVALADQDPKVGAVGAKLVYPSGKLQEAGGIIFSDASGYNFGRGGKPQDPRYDFVREVDYCSAACLLVRTDLFHTLGRFDRRYAPAYYEDTDMCFAIRDAGFRVMYQPLAVIVHHEGFTAGTDTGTGFKRYQEINRPKFAEKWKAALAKQEPPYRERLRRSSNRAPLQRLLVIDMNMPMHDRASGSRRLFEILKLLVAQGHAVTFIAVKSLGQEMYAPELRAMGIETYAGDPDRCHALTGEPCEGETVDLRLMLSEGGFDKAIVAFFFVGEAYIPEIRRHSPNTRIFLDTVDVHHVRQARAAELTRDAKLHTLSLEIRRRELAVCRTADAVITVTENDRAALHAFAPEMVIHVVPNVHDVESDEASQRVPFDLRTGLLFVGNFLHEPNVDAVTYFCSDVWPLIRQQRPDITLTIAGACPTPEVEALASDGVTVTGFVPSMSPLLASHRLSVAPLRYGAGMKGKVGESLSAGLPVVTTSIGAEGMQPTEGSPTLTIADTAAAMANAILALYDDRARWEQLSLSGKQWVRARYGSQVIDRQLTDILRASSFSPRSDPETTVVVVTRDNLLDAQKCLASVFERTTARHRVVVVDDGSTDGTVEFLQCWARAHDEVSLILCKRGRRFSALRNLGLSVATGDFVVWLDVSAVVTDRWLDRMLLVCDRDPSISLVGPMTNGTTGTQGLVGCVYGDVAGLVALAHKNALEQRDQVENVTRLHGFCLLAKRAVLEQIGGLDERLGESGFEFFDFSLRASRAGHQLAVARDAFVHQDVKVPGESSGQVALDREFALFRKKWGVRKDRGRGVELPKDPPAQASLPVARADVTATHVYDDSRHQWEEAGRLGVAVVVIDRPKKTVWRSLAEHTDAASPLQLQIAKGCVAADVQSAMTNRQGWSFFKSELGVVERLNAALRARGDDEPVVLVSSDIELQPGWLDAMNGALSSDARIAIAGPVAMAAPETQRPAHGENVNALRDVSHLGGFLLVMNRRACREVGPLCTEKDLDVALWDYFGRVRAAGQRIVAVPSIEVSHSELVPEEGAEFDELWKGERALETGISESQDAPDTQTALALLKGLVETYPEAARSHQAMGLAQLAMGNLKDAIAELRAAVKRSPADPKLHNQLGYALAENGDTFAAETCFHSAVSLVPNQLDGLFSLVECYRRRRELDGATAMVDRLIAAAPRHPDVLATQAVVALERGDRKTARDALARLREVSPDHPALTALNREATAA